MIKQTQTKMFDFSDVGLDFCSGSKNKFPEVFKKMLATGFNEQIATSVSISGNQITLNYGVTHGYVTDRILQVTASGGFNKEVYIDSVSGQSITCTVLDGITTGLSGTINTKVASLGWQLVYEQAHIHIYKFKHIDETDMFLRLCFQNQNGRRNCISPCIGKTADLSLGTITDTNALAENVSIASPSNGFKWEFASPANSTTDNYSYSQGYSTYGKGLVVGSPYHLVVLSNGNTGTRREMINGIFPSVCFNYEKLKQPLLMGYTYGSITSTFDQYEARCQRAYVGGISVVFDTAANQNVSYLVNHNDLTKTNYLSSALDGFNTTTAEPISLYEDNTGQRIGSVYGVYRLKVASLTLYPTNYQQTPSLTTDIDFESNIIVHAGGSGNSESTGTYFLAIPVEEIKIGT